VDSTDTYDEIASLASEKEILVYMDVMKMNNPEVLDGNLNFAIDFFTPNLVHLSTIPNRDVKP